MKRNISQLKLWSTGMVGRLTCLVVLFSIGSSRQSAVSAADSLTIDQVISEVIKSNSRAEAARFMARSAEENASSVGRWNDPMLMFGIQNTPTNFDLDMDPMTMKMVGLSQDIPYSGYLGLQRRSALADARSAEAERSGVEIDLATAARIAFLDLYYLQELLGHLRAQQRLTIEMVDAVTSKYRANQATHDEVLSAQSNQWRLESTILSVEQEIDAARFELNTLRGLPPDSPLPALANHGLQTFPDSVSEWISGAEANYPEFKKLSSKAESYRFSAAASRRMNWPMLNLQAEYGFRSGYELGEHGDAGEPRDDMISLRATLLLPIFSRGAQKSMARSMEAMNQSNLRELEQTRRDTEAALRSLYQRAVRLSQSIELYSGRILPTSEDAYRSALAGYSANRTTLSSLLNYGVAIISDKTTLTELKAELARTLAEASRYFIDPASYVSAESGK